MKTYKQLQESIVRALARFGNVGLRVASQASKSKGLRKVASQASKSKGARRILDATARRAKLDQLIIKNQKRLLNIRQKETTSFNNPNMVKYKKTHKFGLRQKPDGTYEYKQKNKFPDYFTYQNPPHYGSTRGILNPKSTSQSEPYKNPFKRYEKVDNINRPEKIPPKVKKKLDDLDNLHGNMDFSVQRTQQIKGKTKDPLNYRRSSGAKGIDTIDRYPGFTAADAQQEFGKFKGGEYAPKISGKGITSYHGKVGGYYGKGNKAKRRAGEKVEVARFPGIGREQYRATGSGLVPGLSGDIRVNPGSKIGRVVDVEQSIAKSKAKREKLKVLQRRQSEIKKGSKSMQKEIEAMRKRLGGR